MTGTSMRGATALNQALADERGEAAVLRNKGHAHDAAIIEAILDRIAKITEDYRTFVSEGDASFRSGKPAASFRKRFPSWLELGLAELRGRRRWYSLAVVATRPDLEEARAAAEQAAAAAARAPRKKAS